MLERSPAAVSARRSRWRRRNGLAPYRIDIDEHGLAEALTTRLTETEALRGLIKREFRSSAAGAEQGTPAASAPSPLGLRPFHRAAAGPIGRPPVRPRRSLAVDSR
jgi:hypothetical protein